MHLKYLRYQVFCVVVKRGFLPCVKNINLTCNYLKIRWLVQHLDLI